MLHAFVAEVALKHGQENSKSLCACRWLEDEFFAEQRLSGANPMIIQKLEHDDPRAVVLEHHEDDLDFVLNNQLSKGNIYVCDYTGTDPMYRGPVMVNVCYFSGLLSLKFMIFWMRFNVVYLIVLKTVTSTTPPRFFQGSCSSNS